MLESGLDQISGNFRIHGKTWHIQPLILHAKGVNGFRILVHNDHPHATAQQRAGQQFACVAITANHIKRFSKPAQAPLQLHPAKLLTETLVLKQGNDNPHGIQPGKHGQINTDHSPHALAAGEVVGDFTKANGAAGITDHIESFKKAHAPGVSLIIHPRDQSEAYRGNTVGDYQHHQRHMRRRIMGTTEGMSVTAAG